MKQFVIAGLLAAIGAVVLANGAQAESRYCYDNPDDSRCEYDPDYTPRRRPPPPPPPPIGYDEDRLSEDPDVDGYNPPPGQRPPVLGDYRPPRPPGSWGGENRRRYCNRVGQSLREYGYRRVRPTECDGSNFKYIAYRGPYRYLIKVQARTGRIIYQLPN